ncbi:hypothetical protein PENTCL1PPCAC_7350, partial [Pristionchus entomophagus]
QKRFTECSSLQQMMLIVFSKILRSRRYYDDNYFFELKFHGVTLSLIDWTHPFIDKSIDESIKGAATATDLHYVQRVQMLFKLINDHPERFVERYALCFNEDNVPVLASPIHRASLSPPIGQGWNREAIMKMSQSVDEICDSLSPLPPPEERLSGLLVSFRIDYNHNAPDGYQAPYFLPSKFRTLYMSNKMTPTCSIPAQIPPPQRSLSIKDGKVCSTLAVQSLLSRRSSAPATNAVNYSQRTPHATYTDTSIATSFRNVRETSTPNRNDPQLNHVVQEVLGESEDVSDEEEEREGVQDDDDEEEIEIVRGEEEGGRKRSILDDEEEISSKKSRSISSSILSDDVILRLNSDYDKNEATKLSTSLEVGNSTVAASLRTSLGLDSPQTLEAPETPETVSPSILKKEEKQEDEDGEEEDTDQEDLNETLESDGGEAFFID